VATMVVVAFIDDASHRMRMQSIAKLDEFCQSLPARVREQFSCLLSRFHVFLVVFQELLSFIAEALKRTLQKDLRVPFVAD
jgi:hypothetical protein